jgi:DNA-binding MarR family transcriptional regulator
METLQDGPATPSSIAEQTDRDIAHISRALQELRERDTVDLLVSEDVKKGRFYGLTDSGEELVKELSEVTG